MNDIVWDNIKLAEFRHLAHLTEREDAVLQDWADDMSIVQTHFARNISTRTVDRTRNRIREKYDAVQPFTPLLPKRHRNIPPS
jgi:FixJ family two-component response regulator